MFRKAFQPPLLKKPSSHAQGDESIHEPPPKRPRLSLSEDGSERTSQPALATQSQSLGGREPLVRLENVGNVGPEAYYTVLWRKPTNKKHKTWDGDGVLSVVGGYARLQDVSGKDLGRVKYDLPLLHESTLSVAGKEVEVQSLLRREDFLAREPFTTKTLPHSSPMEPSQTTSRPKTISRPVSRPTSAPIPRPAVQEIKAESFYRPLHAGAPKPSAMRQQYKDPTLSKTILAKTDDSGVTPRHDPNRADALVMQRPDDVPEGERVVDVVVDPILCKRLRKHQREGVKFMYECVMGMRPFDGQGALLADEMGMGKTLQTIALIWTLLKQSPIYDSPPVIKKALIVCPVTLINNWRKEFRKWLGSERIGVFVADGTNNRLRDFTMGKSYSVMIIGYEKLRTVQEELKRGGGIDLVVADEGHRLKTAQNKSAQAIRSLNTPRRIILSGTPIQNDLSEFFTMVDFINPGLLKSYNSFRKSFEGPILRSRQPGATPNDVENGEAASEELSSLTSHFILRRTADLLSEYLPPKTEYVLFCKPTTAQVEVYRHVLTSPVFSKVLGSPEASLQLITLLKKVCNSPTLLTSKSADPDAPASTNASVSTLLSTIPTSLLRTSAASSSGKLRVLDRLLHHIRTTTQEKVVLVSNYTSTLDLLQAHLAKHSYPFLRLDGTTPSSKRQDLVDTFNRTPANICFVFLLSAKAGGVGLNLIGASRLVLFEVDWNPSTDLQAMARIHRDGQKRPVRIYRLLVAGALDEKVWQRQVTKMGLADSVMDQKKNTSSFSVEELRDLFRLDTGGGCRTHELLGCGCAKDGTPAVTDERVPTLPAHEDGGAAGAVVLDSDEEDSDASLPDLLAPHITKASDLLKAEQEPSHKHRRSKLAKSALKSDVVEDEQKDEKESCMQSLMRYLHVDTSRFGLSGSLSEAERQSDGGIIDEVLLRVLREERNRVSFIFAKTSEKKLEDDVVS